MIVKVMSWWRGETRRQRATPRRGGGPLYHGPPSLPVPPEPRPPGFILASGTVPNPAPPNLRYDRVRDKIYANINYSIC